MLTWGLLRTNFSFDTVGLLFSGSLGAGSRHQVIANLKWHFCVVIELHGVGGAAAGSRPKVGRITEHRGHRHKTGDGLYTSSRGNSSDFSPSGMQIAEHISDGFVGSYDLE